MSTTTSYRHKYTGIRTLRHPASILVSAGILAGLCTLVGTGSVRAAETPLTDGSSTAVIDPSIPVSSVSWAVDGVNYLGQEGSWYRVGPTGGELPISSLTQSGVVATGGGLAVTYTHPSFTATVQVLLLGGAAGNGQARLQKIITLTNTTAAPLDLHFFHYVDLDVDEQFAPNTLDISLDGRTATQSSPLGGSVMTLASPAPTAHDAMLYGDLIDQLTDLSPTVLTNTSAQVAGDATFAMQWDVPLAALASTEVVLSQIAPAVAGAVLPAAPSGLAVAAFSPVHVDLSWVNNAPAARGFRIERSTDAGFAPGTVTNFAVVANITGFSDTTVLSNTTYFYRVMAFDVIGDSLPSEVVSLTTPGQLPAGPTALTATVVSARQVDLAWVDNSNNEGSFRIERSTVAGFPAGEITTALAPPNATTFSDTTVADNETFFYRIFAVNTTGDSPASNEVSVTTALAPPSSLTAAAVNNARIDLTWVDNSAAETGFRIERSTDSGFLPAVTVTMPVAANETSFTDETIIANTTYFYRVFALSATGDSAASNVITVTATVTNPQDLPASPSGLFAIPIGPTRVNLIWVDNATTETGMRIERSTDPEFPAASIVVVNVGANATTFSDATVVADTSYSYRVRAVNAAGASLPSAIASVDTPEDRDDDGVEDKDDNSPTVPNSDQEDRDFDRVGDASDGCPDDITKIVPGVCGCGKPDTDGDGDGVLDCIDNCPTVANADQADSAGDGIGDACSGSSPPAGGGLCGAGMVEMMFLSAVGLLFIQRGRRRGSW